MEPLNNVVDLCEYGGRWRDVGHTASVMYTEQLLFISLEMLVLRTSAEVNRKCTSVDNGEWLPLFRNTLRLISGTCHGHVIHLTIPLHTHTCSAGPSVVGRGSIEYREP